MTPLWKQVFDKVEQATAPVLADVTASNQFAEVMRVGLKISNDMARQSEALSRQWLHAWNLPAAGDVAYLKTQIGSLEAEVRSLTRAVEAATQPAPKAKAATKKAPAKRNRKTKLNAA